MYNAAFVHCFELCIADLMLTIFGDQVDGTIILVLVVKFLASLFEPIMQTLFPICFSITTNCFTFMSKVGSGYIPVL